MRLVILGMHRSGTSLVAGLTNLMGFYAGDPESLMPAAEDNPKGFWERLDVVEINDVLLATECASWANPLPFTSGKPSPDLDRRIGRVLEDLDDHQPWLMKDPRFCLTLPTWAGKIHEPSIVFVHRGALPIARSLKSRNGLPLRYGLALWELYTVSALQAIAPYPRYLIRHEDLLTDLLGTMTGLFRWAKDQGCRNISAPTQAQIEELFDPRLVHQRPDAMDMARFMSSKQRLLDKGISDGSLFQHLGRLETSDESLALLQEFGGLVSPTDEMRRLRRDQSRLAAEVQQLQGKLHTVRSNYGATMEIFDQALNPATGGKLARLIDLINRSTKLARGDRDLATSFDQVTRILESYKKNRGRIGEVDFIPRQRIPTGDGAEAPVSLPLRFPAARGPRVSILIPVYNQYQTNLRCLEAILKHTSAALDFEVILADDCSTDKTKDIGKVSENLIHYRQETNQGFLLNCNRAASAARGEFLVILNNDTRVQEGWLEALLDAMENDHSIGLTGPKLVFPDGLLQEAGGIIWRDGSGWNYGRSQDPDGPEYNYLREVDYVSGACMLIPRALWNDLGGFDERFVPAYYEDTDLAFKVRAQGLKVVYVPQSEVVHLEGVSHGTDTESGTKHHQVRNRELFRKKWRKELDGFHFTNGDSVFQARDRSRNQRTILVIDHYVPQYDKDAGSRSTWQYLKLFVEQGLQVKFIGDNFIRSEPYTSELQKMGIEVLYGRSYCLTWKTWLRNAAAYIDLIYMQRPHITEKYIDFIETLYPRPRLLYFGHDLHYLRTMRQFEIDGDESLQRESDDWRRRELAIIDKVDVTFFPSALEVELLKKERPGSAVKRLPLNIWPEPAGDVPPFSERKGLLFVGGFGHPPNLDGIRWFIDEIWPSVQREIPAINLHIVGSNAPDEIVELHGEKILIHGYLSDRELEALYRRVRITVVPLRYGAGVKGKVLESLFHGVPAVTTPIGAEGIAAPDDALTICGEAQAFADAVLDCYGQETRWSQMSRAGRSLIRNQFSTDAVVRLIGQDFLFPGTAEVRR